MDTLNVILVIIICLSAGMAWKSIELKKERKFLRAFRFLIYAYILTMLVLVIQAYVMSYFK
jgi:hypothetical protein